MSETPHDAVENGMKLEDTMEKTQLKGDCTDAVNNKIAEEDAEDTEKEIASERTACIDSDSEDPLLEYEKIVSHQFSTEDEAYQFFLDYSKEKGFSVRKDLLKYNTKDIPVLRRFVCSYAGFKRHREALKRKLRKSRRVGCPVLLTVKYDFRACNWFVDNFIDEHNHKLASNEEEAIQLRSHRKNPEAHK